MRRVGIAGVDGVAVDVRAGPRPPTRPTAAARRWLVVVGGLASALVAACGDRPPAAEPAEAPVPQAERYGGTAVVGGRTRINTLNPLVSTDFEPAQLQKHALLMTLVRYDSTARLRPYLADSWELNRDSTQIVFRLRRDVRWHDGRQTTARDVAFTFERVKDPAVAFPNRGWFDLWEAAEVVDLFTVRFVLRPHADFLFGWSQLAIVPEHVLGDADPEELVRHPYGTEPLGNGPFRFVGREGTERFSFAANPDFPAALGGRPYLDRLVYRAVPDATTLLAELRTGGVHFYMDLPPSQIEQAAGDSALRVVTRPSRSYTFIAWNSRRPPFQEAAVRRAFTLALDRDGLVAAVRGGLGTVTASPLGPWHWAYDSARAPLPFAADSARALLERAGWRDTDADGVRERNGRPLSFQLVTNPNQVRQDAAVIIQSQLAAVGAAVELRTLENAALGAAVTSPERRFDAAILGFEQDWVLDDRDLWACERIGQPFQFTSYCSPELDPVLDSIPRALDREVRRRLYRRYDEILGRDLPFTVLFFETVAAGLRRELRGVRLDARGELARARQWWIHPDAR